MFNGVQITWLGHATFLVKTPEGKTILIDPWLAGNPSCPEAFHDVEVDAILITHGHGDHIGNVFDAAERCNGPIVGIFDLTTWLGHKGIDSDKLVGMNKGGRIHLDDLKLEVHMTDARHSSGFDDNGQIVYLGEAAGYVLGFSNGLRIYFAGDTCLFGDMALIAELESPSIAVLPIGDHFTMDPKAGAYACKLLQVDHVIPCHYGTFPLLHGSPDQLTEALAALDLDTQVLVLEPGKATE